jgi:hypothetical protein
VENEDGFSEEERDDKGPIKNPTVNEIQPAIAKEASDKVASATQS